MTHSTKESQKKRENDRYAEKAKIKAKLMWQLIHKEAENFPSYDQKIYLETERGTTTNLQKVIEMLNSYFVEIVDELIQHNTSHINNQIL